MPPDKSDPLRASLFGGGFQSALLQSVQPLPADNTADDPGLQAMAVDGPPGDAAPRSPPLLPASKYTAYDDCLDDEPLDRLTLLPTATYSDDDDDSMDGDRTKDDDGNGAPCCLDAEQQGREIADIIMHNEIQRTAEENQTMAKLSAALVTPSERYAGYKMALEQQARADKEAASKRQKTSHAAGGPGPAPYPSVLPVPAASTSRARPAAAYRPGRYTLPPDSGDFIATRTASGKALYFAVRTEADLAEQLDKIAVPAADVRLTSSQINRVVADIESDLDTAAALRSSAMDQDADEPPADQRADGGATSSRLWVDKYRPRAFLDLISDARTNRAVMQWLKEWDHCVFGRESLVAKRATQLAGPEDDGTPAPLNRDKWKRPQRRILLLSGPPGLGKTTLAHVAARQAGYDVAEINASDDRTATKIRDRVLGVTQTHAVDVAGRRKQPQLLVIDEIDGASAAQSAHGDFISVLVKLATAEATPPPQPLPSGKQGGRKPRQRQRGEHGPLLRPIICICNNVYAPVLRPLRQIAQWYHVGAPTPARLARRLEEVCELEGVTADKWGLLELAKQNEGDIRSCLNSLQMVSERAARVGPEQLKSSAVGMKDVQRSLFAVWAMIFTTPDASSLAFAQTLLGKRTVAGAATATKPSLERDYAEVLVQSVRSSGERERVMQGCFENYLRMDFRDLTHTRIANLCTDWLEFYDCVDAACRKNPTTTDTFAPYMDYALLAVHRACSTQIGLSRGDFEYPHSEFEAFQGRQAASSILQALLAGATSLRTRSSFTAGSAAEGLTDHLLHILSPQLVTANKHLLKGAERDRMLRLVEVMDAWQLSLIQNKDADGQFVYRLEPPIDRLYGFNGRRPQRPIMSMRYQVRQLVSQELERARLARLAARSGDGSESAPGDDAGAKDLAKRDYLRKLFTDPLADKAASASLDATGDSEPVVRDFFGRPVARKAPVPLPEGGDSAPARQTDPVDKPRAWFRFFEGFSNAVRKPTPMKDML